MKKDYLSKNSLIIIVSVAVVVLSLGAFFLYRSLTNRQKPTAFYEVNPDLPLATQWGPKEISLASTNIQDSFFRFRDERGMYSSLITCSLPDACTVTEPNHRAGYGMLWGLNERYLREKDQNSLSQLKTMIAAYQGLIDANEYVFQNNNFNCLIMTDIIQNPDLTPAEKSTLQTICTQSINEYLLNDLELGKMTEAELIAGSQAKINSLLGESEAYDWNQDIILNQLLKADQFLQASAFNYFIYLPDAMAKYQMQSGLGLEEMTVKSRYEIIVNFYEMLSVLRFYEQDIDPINSQTVRLALERAQTFTSALGLSLDQNQLQALTQKYNTTPTIDDLNTTPANILAQLVFIENHLSQPDQEFNQLLNQTIINNFYVTRQGLTGFSDGLEPVQGLPRFEAYTNGILIGGLSPRSVE